MNHARPHVPGREGIELVLVDFDDTIVETAPRFQNARRRLFELLVAAGFDADACERLHYEEVDPSMLHRFGLGPGRLVHSFPETYRRLCVAIGRAPEDATVAELIALARGVAGTPPLLDGALHALERLARALPTVVYTQSGEPDYQLECLREAGVLDVVGRDHVRVTDVKTGARLREALDELGVSDPSAAWMIGNSIRSDVNPALEIGANAILIQIDDPWHHDEVEPIRTGFPSVRSLAEAASLLLASEPDPKPWPR
ncbi:MAG TPA: HAD family hydrolase [Longimicrobiales bacterium]|nr:HAD family hydrolase [Longimicrobiales bacterium]